ncbi:MAG TPA: SMC-Scp complex subunit ScpB [Clostridiales bacterium]|nr:SMC-Scp complex subunit ScpB [Clostridiales bacterium]
MYLEENNDNNPIDKYENIDEKTNMEEADKIEGIIEGLLFASGVPLHKEKIMELLDIDEGKVVDTLERMNMKYGRNSRGIMIRKINDCYQLCTKPQYSDYIAKLVEPGYKSTLSQAAYETLAIIAYNKPITKAGIEKIRGVNCDSSIAKLLEGNLIREAGRMDSPGRPILYETTEDFLRYFGFSSNDDLYSLKGIADLK